MTGPVSRAASGARAATPARAALPGVRIFSRRFALRVTLQAVVLILLLATVLAVGVVSFFSRREATEDLERQLQTVAARGVSSEMQAFLGAGPRTIVDLDTRATYGRLPVDDPEQLAAFLADRLRYEQTIDRLMYGEQATGTLVAATRDDANEVVILLSDPTLDDGQPTAWVSHQDGTRTPYARALPPEVDARERPWYRAARDSRGRLVWVGPFEGLDGVPVMAVATDVRDPATRALRGVWSAQFSLAALPGLLREATARRPDVQALLLTRDGGLIASASQVVPERLAAANAALPAPLATLPLDTPIPVQFEYQGESWAGGIQGFQVGGNLDWFVGFYLPERSFLQAVYESQRNAFAAGLVFLAVGVALGALIAARIARPLRVIADDLIQVAQFQLSAAPSPQSFVKEVAVVSDAADRMKASLRSFGRYVPADLVRDMLARGEEARLGGETRALTIHFSDIESFTHLSEHLTPAQLVEDLAEYLDCMSDTIRAHDGTIDKFIGDGIMAFWNAPNLVPDHAAQACRAALRAQERLQALRQRWEAAGQPLFRARIGLHTGEVIVGNFGTEERFAYTAMGDSVNLASRLEGLNKAYGTYVMASEAVRDAAGPSFEWRRLDRVAVVGRSEGTAVYELLGERGAVPPELLAARDLYEQALVAYFAAHFAEAAASFRAAAAARPDDQAAVMMARRADQWAAYPPPPGWDGIHVSSSK